MCFLVQRRPSARDTPARKRNSTDKTQWRTNDDCIDDFLQESNLHDIRNVVPKEQGTPKVARGGGIPVYELPFSDEDDDDVEVVHDQL